MAWELTGNAGVDPAANFLGTTDNEPLIIKTNGAEHIRVTSNGNVGIGMATPTALLHISGANQNFNGNPLFRISDTKLNDSFGIDNGHTSNAFRLYAAGHNIEFQTAANPHQIVVATSGNVGIGTGTPLPQHTLEVVAAGGNTAVSGFGSTGIGVAGYSNTATGVSGISYGPSPTGIGVHGSSDNGIGVWGEGGMIGVKGYSNLGGSGVLGQVYGDQPAVVGISGDSTNSGFGAGVYGSGYSGPGVAASSIKEAGVDASSTRNWCGFFHSTGDITNTAKGVYISVPTGQPGLQVASGTKSAVVATSQGSRALHTEESAGVWFTDYGFAHFQAGRAVVTIDPLFAETVNLSEPYHVFVQLNDADAEGVAVVNKTTSSFEVVELRNGRSNAEFSYRLVAARRGYETRRLEHVPWAEDDPNLYPEKRSAWEAQQRLRRPEIPEIEVPPRPPERLR